MVLYSVGIYREISCARLRLSIQPVFMETDTQRKTSRVSGKVAALYCRRIVQNSSSLLRTEIREIECHPDLLNQVKGKSFCQKAAAQSSALFKAI